MITDELEIVVSQAKEQAGILGAGGLVLDRIFDVHELEPAR